MMDNKKLIVFGVSLIADIVYDSIANTDGSEYQIAAFCVDRDHLKETSHHGLPVFAFEDIEKGSPPDGSEMLIAIGYHDMNRVRAERMAAAKRKGYQLASYIHPNADVAPSAVIGDNVLILGGASVGPFAEIGDGTSIYPGAAIAHHAVVGRCCWITSGSVVGGSSRVGDRCFLGINSTVGHNISIGANTFLGANALVTHDADANGVYVVPDTPRYRLDTDRFIKMFNFE